MYFKTVATIVAKLFHWTKTYNICPCISLNIHHIEKFYAAQVSSLNFCIMSLVFEKIHEVQSKLCVKCNLHTRVYPEVSGLAAWSENCKWYSSLPLGAVVSLFCESV
jgi:hypothetical protein